MSAVPDATGRLVGDDEIAARAFPDGGMGDVRRAKGLPRIAPAAWHGPLGEAVRRLAPATEADPVAILVSVLALFGGVVGDGPHVRVGGMRHPARIWPLIVGRTSAGRKGTSWAEARNFVSSFSAYSRSYCATRIVSGLSSGEGLINAISEDGKAPDGRLTVVEPEFARVLAAAKREGSILAPVLRGLWEDGSAATLTRHSPLSCTGAHVVFIGHVTPLELRVKLADSEITGGTVNRLLPILTERSQLLPHAPAREEMADLALGLGEAAELMRTAGEIRRTKDADRLWTDAYRALAEDEPDGLLGAILARGPAYSLRLALLYALAERSKVISTDHLRAGLAVWQYAADSARLLFGDLSGSNDLDRLTDYLSRSAGGRTRTEINSDLFKRNKSADVIDAMLTALVNAGDVAAEVDTSRRGRPTTRYFWLGPTTDSLPALLAEGPGVPRGYAINEVTTKACRVCGEPLDAVLTGEGVHPLCDGATN